MAQLIVPEHGKRENYLTAGEERIRDFFLGCSGNAYEEALQGADWELFSQISPMREGILNWYPFEEDSSLLQLSCGFGAVAGLFARRVRRVTLLEESPERAECIARRYEAYDNITIVTERAELEGKRFDYIAVEQAMDSLEQVDRLLKEMRPLLKDNGRLLFICENRFGMKYWCGAPDSRLRQPFAGIRGKGEKERITRQSLMEMLEQSGFAGGWKLYYPMPDDKLPQAVYTDAYLPGVSLRDRVIPYYTPWDCGSLLCLESEISDGLIANGVLPVFSNSFLAECSPAGLKSPVIYAALSTDRGREHGFATVILENGRVQKKALYPEGRESLRQLHQNYLELCRRGICCVEETLDGDKIEMPYVREKNLAEYLKGIFAEDRETVEKIFEELYRLILQSSREVPFESCRLRDGRLGKDNAGPILQRAYIDMIPYNCFYAGGKFSFYDQEFVRECFPARYVLFRALRYTYLYIPEAENLLPLQYFKDKYNMAELWPVFEEEEARFIESNRNYRTQSSFYGWAGAGERAAEENAERLLKKADGRKFRKKTWDLKNFYQDSHLAAVKRCEMGLLRELVRVCREQDLSFCAFYGTLLGMVRHKGFIPWDDDVDIAMPRKDYDRLVAIAPQVFSGRYFLQTPESDTECFYGGYSKLRDSATTGLEERNAGRLCNQGIWIDILPLDELPEEEERREEQKKKIQLFQRLLYKKTYPEKRVLTDRPEAEEEACLSVSRELSREYLCRQLHEAFLEGSGGEGRKLAVLARYWGEKSCTEYDREAFEYLIPGQYEDMTLYMPVGYESCLKKDYGPDYAMYPEEADRLPHHRAFFDTEKPYVDYLRENG